MTAAEFVVPAERVEAARVGRGPVLALARFEARHYARRWSVWLGWAGTVAIALRSRPDWAGGAYAQVIPVSFAALALGTFVAGVRTGGRDGDADTGPLAEEAALDAPARATARLLGLAVPVGIALATALVIGLASRVEGGFWLGDSPRRTDTANHSVVELLQPVLLVAIFGAAGVVLGRRIRRAVLAIATGVFVWTALFPLYWMWNGESSYPAALVQTMPLRVRLFDVRSFADTPVDWWVERPTAYRAQFARDVVHQPTVALHLVYLAGLLALIVAGSLPTRRAAVRVAGVVFVMFGLVGQWMVSPL